MAKKTHILIHHSATEDGTTNSWPAIKKYHMQELGYVDIGYQWGVENVNGKIVIQKGRDENAVGAHTKQQNMNELGIGICVVGNFDITVPSEETYAVLANLCADICRRHGIPVENIQPHNKYAVKSCPGKNLDMNKLRNMTKLLLNPVKKPATKFKDLEGHWAKEEIELAASPELGLVKGSQDGNFYPNNFITRAEAVVMLMRLYRLLKGD